MESKAVEQMDRIRKSIGEIMAIIERRGQISLGDADSIAARHGADMQNILFEIAVRCHVDYRRGVIQCKE